MRTSISGPIRRPPIRGSNPAAYSRAIMRRPTSCRCSIRPGEGEAGGAGAQNGDLYVEIAVREHAVFQRDGADLYMDVPVSFTDAALGKEVEIPTLDGRVNLKIPEGTQTGRLFRLRGKGVKPIRTTMVGDLLCRVVVETPVNLNHRQKELLRELQSNMDHDGQQSPNKKSFFDKLGELFS